MDQGRASGTFGHRPFHAPVVQGQHVVLGGLDQPEPLQLGQLLGVVGRQVAGLAVVAVPVVELPHVVVERRQDATDHDPGCLVLGDRAPALVVDTAVGKHLEVLQVVALRGVALVEAVQHAGALHRRLQHAVDHGRLGQPGRLEDGRRQVDHVGELGAQAAGLLDPVRPVHDGPVAGAAPVRGHLLGPLERGVVRPGPPDRVVVVGVRPAEGVHLAEHELGGLECGHAVEVGQLVEGAVHRALGRGAVVADDVVDDRVVEDLQVGKGVDQTADVVVGVLEEPGVDLHLPGQHRLELLGHVVPGGDLFVPRGQLGVLRDDPQFLLPGEGASRAGRPSRRRTRPGSGRPTPSGRGEGRGWRRGRSR